jgi:hypothetical protein
VTPKVLRGQTGDAPGSPNLPVAEKLRLLDVLRERNLAIAAARPKLHQAQKNSVTAWNFFRDGLRTSDNHLISL